MQKYALCLDWQKWQRKPAPTREEAGRISYRIARQEQELSISQLGASLLLGQSWCPATFNVCPQRNMPYRHASLFKQMQLLVVDIDHGNHSPQDLLELCKEHAIWPSLLHSSFSHTKDAPKWRIVFALDKPSEKPVNTLAMLRYLSNVFGGDPACADIARLFYGTHADAFLQTWPEQMLSRDKLETIAQQAGFFNYAGKGQKQLEPVLTEQEQLQAIRKLTPAQRRLLAFAIEDARKLLADPVGEAGSGYMAAWRAGFKLGQFACLHEAYIVQILEKERALHAEAWRAGKHDYAKVIASGVQWARQHGRF